jgi:hypothetical protein
MLAPWTLRNLHVHESLVIISPNGGLNLWAGNSDILKGGLEEGDYTRLGYLESGTTTREREAYAWRMGIQRIREQQPLWILMKLARYLHSWRVGYAFELRHFRLGLYGDMPPWVEHILVTCIKYIYLVVMVGAILGVVWTRYSSEKWLLLGLVLCSSAVYVVTLSRHARFRVPLVAILIMFCADGYRRLGSFLKHRFRKTRIDLHGPEPGRGLSPVRRATMLRLVLYILANGLLALISTTDILALARRVLP